MDDADVAHIRATGDGDAGTFSGKLVAQSLWTIGKTLAVRTNEVNVANAGSVFSMSGNIYANQAQAQTDDIYQKEFRDSVNYRAMIRKTGNGDLVLYDETVSLADPTVVDAGRLVLSNKVKMAASSVVLATGADQLVLRKGATIQIGGLSCTAAETIDLNGNTVSVGGTADDAVFNGTFANGTIRKTGFNTQQIGAGLSQTGLDVLGGTLSIGLPAPKVRYAFDDAESIGADSGSLGKTLSLETDGAAVYAGDGVRGGCARFNGTGCLLAGAATGLPSGNAPFTIALWIKTTEIKDNLAFTSWGSHTGVANGYNGFLMPSSTTLKHTFWEGTSGDFTSKASSSSLADGEWHHVALVYDPATGTRTYYIDGAAFDSQILVKTRAVPESSPFKVGHSDNSADFIGCMDEVMVFDYALSAAEVAAVKGWGDGSAISLPALGSGGKARLARDATLALGSASQTFTDISGDGTLALQNGAAATVSSASATSVGRVTGDGTLVKTGAGTLSLTRASNLGATIDVQGGAVAAAGPCVDDDLKGSLVAWWNFDDRDDPGKDASGNGMDLTSCTYKSGSYTCEGWNWRNRFETMGGAAWFDGNSSSNHWLVLANKSNEAKLPGGNGSFTSCMWVKPDSGNASNAGFMYWGAYPNGASRTCNGFRFNSGTTLHHYFWSTDVSSDALPAGFKTGDEFGGWHHIAIVYDGTAKMRTFYIDGVASGGGAATGDINVKSANFFLGGGVGANGYKGYMDDVMIFGKALTADEIKSAMSGFADAPAGGAKVKVAAGTSFAVASGTVGLDAVTGAGGVSVAADSALVLAGGASEIGGGLTGEGTLTVADGASLRLAGGQDFPGTLSVAAGGTLRLGPDGTASVASLTLAEGAKLAVSLDGESGVPCIASAGAVALPASAAVTVSVAGRNGGRVELIRAAGGVTGGVSGWTVDWDVPSPSVTGRITVSGGSVWAAAYPKGTVVIVR